MKGILFLIIILQLNNCMCLEMHALQVRILSYENECNRIFRSGQYVCCDGPFNNNPCEPCDTYFVYCLRFRNPIRTFSFECPSNGRTLVSEVNTDDGPLDFSMSTVLGLPNPFILSGFQDPESFELLIVAIDSDSLTSSEFIDAFMIPLETLTQGQTKVFDEDGQKDNIELCLELTLTCAEGYTGELCDREEEPVTTAATVTELPTMATTTELSSTTALTIEPPTTVGMTTKLLTTAEMTTKPLTIVTMTMTKESTEPATDKVTTETIKTTLPQDNDPLTTTPFIPLNDSCTDTNCSGQGVCVCNEKNISHVCQPGFTGPDCSVKMVLGDDVRGIIGGAIGSLTVIIIAALVLGMAIVFVSKQKCRRQHINEQDAAIEQHLPPMIITNANHDYGMIRNIIYGMQLDTGQREHELVENIYDSCDQVRQESHLYESADHFQMNFNIVYQENEDNYYY